MHTDGNRNVLQSSMQTFFWKTPTPMNQTVLEMCHGKSSAQTKTNTAVLVLATNVEEVLIPQNTENASIWGNCFYGFPHLNLKTVITLEREMRTAASDGIGPLQYPLMYSEWKQTEETSLIRDSNVKQSLLV